MLKKLYRKSIIIYIYILYYFTEIIQCLIIISNHITEKNWNIRVRLLFGFLINLIIFFIEILFVFTFFWYTIITTTLWSNRNEILILTFLILFIFFMQYLFLSFIYVRYIITILFIIYPLINEKWSFYKKNKYYFLNNKDIFIINVLYEISYQLLFHYTTYLNKCILKAKENLTKLPLH